MSTPAQDQMMSVVAQEMARRRLSTSPLLDRMLEVRDRYNADVVVPVPETDREDTTVPYNSLAPLLIADGVDHPALYASQVPPNIFVPALDATKSHGVRSAEFAMKRRKALHFVWDKSWWDLALGRMYRHLAAYATSAMVVEADVENKRPRFTMRDPLTAYPEPKAPEDLSMPRNCGFIRGVAIEWLHSHYPETKETMPKGSGLAVSQSTEGEIWDVVEWYDDEKVVIGVLGPRDEFHSWTAEPLRWCRYLEDYPNVLGRCPAIVPRRVTLDRVISQLSNLTGHADLMARLLHLDILATEASIFPDKYVISKTGQNPRLVGGQWLSGQTGQINQILDADAIGVLPATPDPNNKMTIDRLERNFRISSGLIPQAGGETYGALRTGRGIDALMGAALDPRTTELHKVAERYLTEVNELILLCFAKKYPARQFSVYSPLAPGAEAFIPREHIDRGPDLALFVENRVHYPIPGMDDINATQVIGQMMGAELISAHDARVLHPHVKDPEGTERRLRVEGLNRIFESVLATRANTPPGIPPEDFARIIELVEKGLPLHEAVTKANQEASARQAAAPPPPGPGQLAAPEAMPGLAAPGDGAEMGGQGAPISPPPPAIDNLRSLLSAFPAEEAASA